MDAISRTGPLQRKQGLPEKFFGRLRQEVRDKGVYVTAVCPAGIATDLYGLNRHWQGIGLKLHALSTPDFCARRGLNSLWKRRRCVVPDWWMRLFIPICLALPSFAMRWLRNYTNKWQH